MARFVGPFKFSGNVGGFRGYWDEDLQEWVLATTKQKNPNHNRLYWGQESFHREDNLKQKKHLQNKL